MANDINLAALWVPVMPETSHIAPEMVKAGAAAKKGFVEGFKGGGGESPEALGAQWSSQFMKSFNSTFEGMEMPRGMENFMESMEQKTGKTAAETRKLATENKKLYDEWQDGLKRVAAAQDNVNRLQKIADDYVKRGVAGQGGHLSILKSLNAAKGEEARATEDAGRKHRDYADSANKADTASRGFAGGGRMAAAAIGGIAGAISTLGIQAFTAGLEAAAEAAKELGSFVLESGEILESQSIQIQTYSLASGDALETLKTNALNVYSAIDTEGKNVGETVTQLSTQLGLSGEPLERLATHLEELSGRYGAIDVAAFTGTLANFNVEGERADQVLASWLQTARGAGMGLDTLAGDLASTSNVLGDLGFSAEQGGYLVAQLESKNISAVSSINKLQTAQKAFSDKGLTFSDGIKLATTRINDLMAAGDKAGAQKIGQELFGSEKLVDTLSTLESINATLGQTPESLAASQDSIDKFAEDTRGLGETWENLKHQALVALSPLGEEVMGIFSGMLTKVKGYLDAHMPEIKARAKEMGAMFIRALPEIIDFAKGAITVLGQFGDFAIEVLGGVAQILGAIEKAWGKITFDKETAQAGEDLFKAGTDILKLDFTETTKLLNKGLDKLKEDLPPINDSVNEFGDAMGNVPDNISPSITPQITAPPNNWFGITPGTPIPGAVPGLGRPPGAGNSAPTGTPGAPGPLGVPRSPGAPAPSALPPGVSYYGADGTPYGPDSMPVPGVPKRGTPPGSAPGGAPTSPFDPNPLPLPGSPIHRPSPPPAATPSSSSSDEKVPPYMFIPVVGTWIDWFMRTPEANAAAPGPQQAFNPGPMAPGAAGPTDDKEARVAANKALAQQYFSSYFDAAEWGAFEELERREAGFDNMAANPTSSARGMGQFMNDATNGNTWTTMGLSGPTNDPALQLDAMFRYIAMKYGTPSAALAFHDQNNWYASGGTIGAHPGGPKDKDTVPIWAEPGEEIVNAEMASKHRATIKAINAGYFASGGAVPYSAQFGVGSGTDIRQGAAGFPPWVYALAAQYGLSASTYPGHQQGFGIDWWGPVANLQAFAEALVTDGGMPQVIWNNPETGQKIGMANGQMVGPGTSQPQYYAANWAGHTNHVHTRWSPELYDSTGGGPSYSPSPVYPGLPGQDSGYGAYGAQDLTSVRQHQQAVQDAKDRAADMDWDIEQQKIEVANNEKKLADLQAQTDWAGDALATQEQLDAANQALATSRHELSVKERERGQQDDKIADTEREQAEAAMKAPKGSKTGAGGKDSTSQFSQLGSGLMKGIAQEMGFGDVFAKPPWEWGIVKLMGGLANWGLGTANAWSDEIGKGHTGMTGFAPIPGYENAGANPFGGGGGGGGIFGTLANMLPSNTIGQQPQPNVSTAPNVAPGTVGVQGTGPLPGPAPVSVTQNFPVTKGTGVDAANAHKNAVESRGNSHIN